VKIDQPILMPESKQAELAFCLNKFQRDATLKYVQGHIEHGNETLASHTNLWLIEEAMKETIDQWVFLSVLYEKEKLRMSKLDSSQ
jgi:hypothetical protein